MFILNANLKLHSIIKFLKVFFVQSYPFFIYYVEHAINFYFRERYRFIHLILFDNVASYIQIFVMAFHRMKYFVKREQIYISTSK